MRAPRARFLSHVAPSCYSVRRQAIPMQ